VFASETDRALSETAHELRKLDAAQTVEPSPDFLLALEKHLMSSKAPGHSWSGPTTEPATETLTSPGRQFRPDGMGARVNRRSSFAALALVFALIVTSAGAIFVTNQLRDGGGDAPSTYTAMGSGSLETPTAESGEDVTGSEWTVSTAASARIATDEIGMAEGLAVIGDKLIRAWSDSKTSGLEALSTADGTLIWSNDTPWTSAPSDFPTAIANYAFQLDANNVYVVTQLPQVAGEVMQLALTAIDIESGHDAWTREFNGGIATFGTGPSGLYVRSFGSGLSKLDPATGDIIWTIEADMQVTGSIAPYSGNDVLVVVDSNGLVQSIDPETGELIWSIATDLPPFYFSIAEGALESGKKVVIIRAAEQKKEEFEGQHFDENKSTLMAVDLETGEILWSQTLNDPSKGQMQIARGMIYATTSLVRYDINNDSGERVDTGFRNWLVAIDLETGDEVWSIESDPAWGMAFALTDDTLIMYRSFGSFVAVDLETGAITCDAFMPSGASSDDDDRSPDSGAYDGEMLYLSLKNGDVMAVDPGDWSC
jgi:outer membrane protein assembly factor BamB